MWPTPATTECHKVQMTLAVDSYQRISHQVKTRTLKPEECATQFFYH